MKDLNNIFKKYLKVFLGEKTYDYLVRIYLSALILPRDLRDTVAIRSYFIYLTAIKARQKSTVNKREKPHVLFVTEKWCDCNPAKGVTNSEHNLFGSLESTGLATYERFHFDEYCRRHRGICDFALLRKCLESRPDMLFFTFCGGGYCPRWVTLRLISKKFGIPVVALWWDDIGERAEQALRYVDLNIVLHLMAMQRASHPEKYLLMWVPQDPRVYYNPDVNRDIDISFLGAVNKMPDRRAGIEALRLNGIEVYQTGGQRENPVSVAEYARGFMRSKIALSFGIGWAGIQQAKSRIFEATLCGAMLLGADNADTNCWFEPMMEYVPFSGEADLVKKAKYYLHHNVEREQIAARGYQKARDRYNARLFWETIFDRVFSNIPGVNKNAKNVQAAKQEIKPQIIEDRA